MFATPSRHGPAGLRGLSLLLALLVFALLQTTALARPDAKSRRQTGAGDRYLLGVGKADMTGPVVEIGFAGYADLAQKGSGVRQRLYSRAFIVADAQNPSDRFIYLVLDTQTGDTAIRRGILEGLAALGSDYAVYDRNNVAVTGTHSHAGPGAFFNYLLPQITNLGFEKQSYQAIVDGALLSIKRAHQSLTAGYLDFGTTDIKDGAINRSLFAYLANPAAERARYADSVDTAMTLLRFRRASDNKALGVLSWFAVHPTSIYQNSTIVAGDNKGVASWLMERDAASDPRAAEGFVAGFAQANHADTTPNVLGAFCDDGTGDPCDLETSTCADGKVQSCRGRGPFFQALDKGISSCYEMGRRQYAGAKKIYDSLDASSTPIVGNTVKSFHFFHNMAFYSFKDRAGNQVQTCPASLGYSFAAGTTDGPGAADFTQGEAGQPNNPLWQAVAGLLRTPTDEQKACQEPKPVLLDVGEMDSPYAWSANIVDFQTFRVGQLVIIAASPEVTTMAGRRWREAVAAASGPLTSEKPLVVLGGPANTYSHYLTTPEEYNVQRYEGASTFYGRNSLEAYITLTLSNLHYLTPTSTSHPPAGPQPPDNRQNSLNFNTGVALDGTPIGRAFGAVITQPAASYARGASVSVRFQGANPRNNLRLEGTFAAIERQVGSSWVKVRDDKDWFLTYEWVRTNWLLGYSEVIITWETGEGGRALEAGTYRVKYYGDSKSLFGSISAFEGTSQAFQLV